MAQERQIVGQERIKETHREERKMSRRDRVRDYKLGGGPVRKRDSDIEN